MDKEELKEDIMEEVNDVVELTEDEEEEITGGEAGYGNIQFQCRACGRNFLNAKKLVIHFAATSHKSAFVYRQNIKGKSSKGKKIGSGVVTCKSQRNHAGHGIYRVELSYPNGRKYTWVITNYAGITNNEKCMHAFCEGYTIRSC